MDEQPRVTVLNDEIIIEWGQHVVMSVTEDGFGYAILNGDEYKPGKHEKMVDAIREIRTELAVRKSSTQP